MNIIFNPGTACLSKLDIYTKDKIRGEYLLFKGIHHRIIGSYLCAFKINFDLLFIIRNLKNKRKSLTMANS